LQTIRYLRMFYKIPCKNCNKTYIGEHLEYDFRNIDKKSLNVICQGI